MHSTSPQIHRTDRRVAALWSLAAASMLVAGRPLGAAECRDLHSGIATKVFTWSVNPRVEGAVAEILEVSDPDFDLDILPAEVKNAAAVQCDDQAAVLYSSETLGDLLSHPSGGRWAMLTVFAHEVGHHLEGHLSLGGISSKKKETDADRFAGRVVCRLGGDRQDATHSLFLVDARQDVTYPTFAERQSAVSDGWLEAFLGEECPIENSLTDRDNQLSISRQLDSDPELSFGPRTVLLLVAGEIRFDNVKFRTSRPMILFADRILLNNATVHAPQLWLIADEVAGTDGRVSTDGEPGENGGEILVAATELTGLVLSARGGDGETGAEGKPGLTGREGLPGRDGSCSDERRSGATRDGIGEVGGDGGTGEKGGDGRTGEKGGDGGDGGRILLFTHQQSGILLHIDGGKKGEGGPGGPQGEPGIGGPGGLGCSGKRAPRGPDGPPKTADAKGAKGPCGKPGARGDSDRHEIGPQDVRRLAHRHNKELGAMVRELKRENEAETKRKGAQS